jgi:hypothetical protein
MCFFVNTYFLFFTRHITHLFSPQYAVHRPVSANTWIISIVLTPSLYKLFIRSVLTYAAPVWSNTSSSNYRRPQILQSKCLRVIGNYPRRTPIPRLHRALNDAPIRDFIYNLTHNFFDSCPAHPNTLVRSI